MYQLRQHPTYRRLSAHFGAGRGGRQRGPPLDDMANDLNYDLDHRNSRNHISNDRLSPEPDPHEKPLTAHDFADWERIGRGGFGKVYRATPRSTAPSRLPETVAIKVVDKRTLKGSAAEMRLAAEVAIHETMQHESIVEVLDSFEDDRFVYIVMEHCTGGDLWRYLRQRHADQHLTLDAGISEEGLAVLSEGETRAVMRQVCAAVHHIHTRGAIHRDLKLANIFLTGRGLQAKVGDFGLATWLRADRSMEPVTVCGTPSYISPEMLARRPYGFESDIWALGCLMVALLTGAQPFGRGFTGKITEDRVARIQLPSDLSSEARDLVAAMLRVDPNRRIRSANILQHPFFTGNHARNARANERLLTLDQAREMARRQQVKEQQQLKQQRLLDNRHSTSVLLREQQLQKRNAAGRMLLPKHSRQVDSAMAQNASTLHHHHQNNHHVQQTVDVGRLATRDPQTAATVSSNTPSLQDLSIDRLPAMRRALKGGKLYVHPTPGLLILDLTTAPTAIALDTNQKLIFEYRKPLQTSTLSNTKPIQAHPWDLGALSENIAKTVRVALRCISHIRAQQKRLYVATPQGRAYLYDDGPDATFRLAFFNGIRVEIARRRGLATVEIPSNQDLPDEIQKIPLLASDFPAEATPLGQTSDSRMMLSRGGPRSQPIPMVGSDAEVALEARVPSKIRAIIAHAQEALLRLLQADPLLADYEPGGRLHSSYDGRIEYPVELPWSQWDSSGTLDLPAHYIPPGLKPNAKKLNRRSAIDDIDHRFDERHNGHGSMPSAVGHIGGASTTVFSGTTATVNTVATTATAISPTYGAFRQTFTSTAAAAAATETPKPKSASAATNV
ncbi:hypothetical protein GGI07_003238 [Coemansia sp. Benny D115]|nr:hypothetical protein GGI07_003238 [Coemansia sp. Benny D115]